MINDQKEDRMKKFRFHKWLGGVVTMTILMMATDVIADPMDYKNYGRIGIGANQPTEDLDDAGYDAGVNATLAYGRYLGKYFAIEGALNHFFTDQELSGSSPTAGAYDRDDWLSVTGLLITLKGEIPLGPVRLFAGAGVGVYSAYLDTKIDTANLGRFQMDESDVVFGTHVVTGGFFDITPKIFLGVEGLYRWTGDADMSETVATIPVALEGNLDGYSITITGGFRF